LDLVVKVVGGESYDLSASRFLSSVSLIEKLRETRALVGFSRVFPEDGRSLRARSALLRNNPIAPRMAWLPAQVVFGEGIYLSFNEHRLETWEQLPGVRERVALLADRYATIREQRHLRERAIAPRFVLIHTFAHLLMTRLIFECGYTSASLRERLYVSAEPEQLMAGVLIYTAAGDSDGTMGGLVRMGRPASLEPVIRRALEAGSWCSADPICLESRAQGPQSCNLAACHSCALVPETACEEFNRFLGAVVRNT
jgi:hypothetical protein